MNTAARYTAGRRIRYRLCLAASYANQAEQTRTEQPNSCWYRYNCTAQNFDRSRVTNDARDSTETEVSGSSSQSYAVIYGDSAYASSVSSQSESSNATCSQIAQTAEVTSTDSCQTRTFTRASTALTAEAWISKSNVVSRTCYGEQCWIKAQVNTVSDDVVASEITENCNVE